ncbi:DUF3276 family protein [Spirochaeta isovalerica]|uniref:DUF3276 family protein n=1 Tax=Spirochaeta isovalerica TaxID=150 RepID=A0A841R9J5_9SPIO|nr:DUF3276 family protein [Spirochaeta isovalerica]MBB6479132.1 hypothetical protein [Spirochaeta isovalerica]
MGKRGELFTEKLFSENGSKTYFFNVKENRFGDYFLNIVESSKNDNGRFDRYSIIVFEEDLDLFVSDFRKAATAAKEMDSEYMKELRTGSGKRVYTFHVKKSSRGDFNLIIGESRSNYSGSFQNESIKVFTEDLEKFLENFEKSVAFIESK